MILVIVVILVIIMLALLSVSLGKNCKHDKPYYSVNVYTNGEKTSEITISPATVEKREYKKRPNLAFLEARRERQGKVWAIFRYMNAYYDLLNSSDFYEYKASLSEFNESREKLKVEKPSKIHFDIAFRFCNIKNCIGECEYKLQDNDIIKVRKWKTDTINHSELIENVSKSYKEYWDEVLNSYKRHTARANRLKYLIEKLSEYKQWPELQVVPGAIEQIKILERHFLEQETNN